MTTDRTREQWQRSNQRLHRENLELRAEVARLRAAIIRDIPGGNSKQCRLCNWDPWGGTQEERHADLCPAKRSTSDSPQAGDKGGLMRNHQDAVDHCTQLREQARKDARKALRDLKKSREFAEQMSDVRARVQTTMRMLEWMRDQGPGGVALADECERQRAAEEAEIDAAMAADDRSPVGGTDT